MKFQVTIDSGLMRDQVLLPAVETMKKWEAQGKIEIFESDRSKEPAAKPVVPNIPGRYRYVPKRVDQGAASFAQISSVLYPMRDPNRLNMTEVNDVAHLQRHLSQKRSIFVTTNTPFVEGGKQERLRNAFQAIVLTPDEAVEAIRRAS